MPVALRHWLQGGDFQLQLALLELANLQLLLVVRPLQLVQAARMALARLSEALIGVVGRSEARLWLNEQNNR